MLSYIDDALKSTESVLSEMAESVRETVSSQTTLIVDSISESDFYKSHLAYVPPDEESAMQNQNARNDNKGGGDGKEKESSTTTGEENEEENLPADEDELRDEDADEEREEYDFFFSSSSPSTVEPPPSPSFPDHTARAPARGSKKRGKVSDADLLSRIDEVPIEERIEAAAHSIGWLNVKIGNLVGCSVDGTFLPGRTRPYLRLVLGSQQSWTSNVCESEESPGEFTFSSSIFPAPKEEEEEAKKKKPETLEVHLVAQDIHSDLFVTLHQKNVFATDRLLGTIVVPLSSIIPKVRDALARASFLVTPASQKPYVLKSWFEFFPLPEEAKKFQGAASDINGTGMTRPDHPIGYLEMEIELHLHGRISLWAGYAMKPYSPAIADTNPVLPLGGDIKMITAVVDTGRRFKRNFQRVKRAFARVVSRGDDTWPAVRFLKRARTWEDPSASLLALTGAFYVCVVSPVYLLPLNTFLALALSTLALHGKHERERRYLVWNQDIHDPDDELGTFQKVAKTIYLLEKFEKWMGITADALERLGNVFSFADERVTLGALLFGLVLALALSLLLCFFPPGYLVFGAFLGWFVGGGRRQGEGPSSRGLLLLLLLFHDRDDAANDDARRRT